MYVFIHAANVYGAPSFVLGTLLGIRDKKVSETQLPNLWRPHSFGGSPVNKQVLPHRVEGAELKNSKACVYSVSGITEVE